MHFQYQISCAQIDPNGLCNSGCWFCPVAYSPNPEFAKKDMPIDTLESLVRQLYEGKGTFVSDNFDFIYTAHYNEVLLYKHFREMLDIFRKYGMRTIVLTNGIPLTNDRVDVIKEYLDVVYGICLNIPASDSATWAKLTGKPEKMFDKVMANVTYAADQLAQMKKDKTLSIQVNGINSLSLTEYGGWITKLANSPEIDMDPQTGELARQVQGFNNTFPEMQVYAMPNLIDRAGHLDKHGVITNIDGIQKIAKRNSSRVIACGNAREVGGRPNGWLHVNANGDTFICCNDYDFESVFGNVNEKQIKDIWMSIEHKQMTVKSFNSMCTTCSAAIWGN